MKKGQKLRRNAWLWDSGMLVLGSFLYAMSVNVFTAYNQIAPGGFTGIATMVRHFTGFPIGVLVLLMNLPLFWLGRRNIGTDFLVKTIVATILSSLLIDVTQLFLPVYTGEKILAALYGGVLSGLGLGVIFLHGGTTGGVDIIAKLLHLRFRHLSMGRMILVQDAVVVLLSAAVFRNLDSALYAMVTMFTSSLIIDKLVYGADAAKTLLVFSEENESIAHRLMEQLHRGVTFFRASGGYTDREKRVLMCTLRSQEVQHACRIIHGEDPMAFTVVLEAGEVMGEGFKPLS